MGDCLGQIPLTRALLFAFWNWVAHSKQLELAVVLHGAPDALRSELHVPGMGQLHTP